jgi:DNA ligase 1
MQRFAAICEAIRGTTKKLEKIRIVADYLRSTTTRDAAVSSVFLSGRPFPAWEETTLQIGGRWLWRIVAELAGKPEQELTGAYRRSGDLGAVAEIVLPAKPNPKQLGVLDAEASFREIARAHGPKAKAALVRDLLSRSSPLEAKYLIKIMTGDLRIGLKESLLEEAIAKTYGTKLAEVQRANMLLGDIGETVRLAAEARLPEARLRLFHPLGFMLASPVESAEEGLGYFAEASVEDKYDGIRAQAHICRGEARFFSRTRDEITESFPELPIALAGLPDAILDGEILAWEDPPEASRNETAAREAGVSGRARPFAVLQPRLGRKKVSQNMMREIPVAFLVFDVLFADGELMIDKPLKERAQVLDRLLRERRKRAAGMGSHRLPPKLFQALLAFDEQEPKADLGADRLMRAPVFHTGSVAELEALFAAARARGNEGLMIKDQNSRYTPGKRGKAWLKMKRELATLDVVVTAVEYGHGKRIGVLSDYTFAVWDSNQERLVNIGKAYSGLTDAEIAEMTEWFLGHTILDEGFRRVVEPKIVLEVAFNNMMRSDRHESGYALRFPRILRLRPDKLAEEADTIERAREIYQQQDPRAEDDRADPAN